MKQTVNFSMFCDAFSNQGGRFTYNGLEAIYDYLENLEEETGEEMELDVVALRCDYSEYGDLAAFQKDYGTEYETIEDIEDRTTVIRIDNESFIIADF